MEYPISEFHLGDTAFSVYRAKFLDSDEWASAQIREKVGVARESYRVYSPTIPAFDSYDAKSAVYAVCAQYPIEFQGEIALLSEWVTIRFVPATGLPELSEDLKQYQVSIGEGLTASVVDQISDRVLHCSTADCLGRMYTHSRFSASRPTAEDTTKQWLVNAYWQAAGMRTKNRWTAVAFALMNRAFMADIQNDSPKLPSIITAQINQKVEETVFLPILRLAGFTDSVVFPYAYQVLGYADSKVVRLNREEYSNYFYSFPGYFFSVTELVAALQLLQSNGTVPASTLERYLDEPWKKVVAAPSYMHLYRLGELLTTSGNIPGSSLTGAELRSYLDSRVSDGVQLRLLTQDLIVQCCDQLLSSQKKKAKQ